MRVLSCPRLSKWSMEPLVSQSNILVHSSDHGLWPAAKRAMPCFHQTCAVNFTSSRKRARSARRTAGSSSRFGKSPQRRSAGLASSVRGSECHFPQRGRFTGADIDRSEHFGTGQGGQRRVHIIDMDDVPPPCPGWSRRARVRGVCAPRRAGTAPRPRPRGRGRGRLPRLMEAHINRAASKASPSACLQRP